MGIFSTTLTLCCLDATHISPAWKHADTLEAFEYRERTEIKKNVWVANVSLIVIDLILWSGGKSRRSDYSPPSFLFKTWEKKKKRNYCPGLLFFNSLVLL